MSSSRQSTRSQRLIGVAVPLALLGLHSALAVSSLTLDSLTFDELGHLTGGTTSWLERDHRMFPQNGPFPKRWAALGVLLVGAQLPSTHQSDWQHSDVDRFGHQFLYSAGNDFRSLLLAGRLPMVLLELSLGLTIFCWSNHVFGRAGAWVSLALFTFSPALLAHGRLATSDTAAALAFMLALLSIWQLIHRVSIARLVVGSLAVGLLLISKMSGLLILPMAVLFVGIRLASRLPLQVQLPRYVALVHRPARQFAWLAASAAVVAAGSVLVIWAAYDFRYSAFRDFEPTRDTFFNGETIDRLTSHTTTGRVIRLARDHRLLPEAYLFGVAHVLRHSEVHPAFMNGEYSLRGWWQFHPYCVLVKTPLAVFVIAAVALWAAYGRKSNRRAQRGVPGHKRRALLPAYRTAPLWLFLAVYWIAAIGVHLSIGERHVLPTYPAVFILCGAAGQAIGKRQRLASAVVVVALIWLAVESLAVWPNYLSYFNELAGGSRHGYRRLVDSNCDWGQDLERLRLWLEERRRTSAETRPVYLSYFGIADPAAAGIDAVLLPGYRDWRDEVTLESLRPGTYVISATMLQCVYNPAFGPWRPEYEQLFDRYFERVEGAYGRPLPLNRLRPGQAPGLSKLAFDFERLRSARLFATLREREPDARISDSLLVYEVSSAELERGVGGR